MTPDRRPSIRITKRASAMFFGALLLFGVGTNVQAGWVLAIAALLIGMLAAGAILPLRGLRGITIEREAPRTAVAGDTVAVTLAVTNSSRRARSLFRVSDDFCGRAFAIVSTVGPGQTRRFTSVRTGARRGVHGMGRVELTTGMPFGVVRVRRALDVPSPIVVYPKVFEVRAVELVGPAGWPAPATVGDVSSVRDYRPGDPLRNIHWRSVARRGQLVVREFDRERSATTAVVAAVPADADQADAVASVACSIAIAGLRNGEVTLDGSRVRAADAILDWGARLAPRDGAPAAIANAARSDAIVFVGTSRLVPADALAAQASSTSVVVVVIDDGGPAADVAGRLRAAGCDVSVVAPNGIETWIESGSVRS